MSQTNRIGLCMIVKNEARIITRCLNSLLGLIDDFVIVDTGSSDNTIEIIKNFAKQHKLKGKVFQRKWVDFGYNRTEALKLAREYMTVDWLLTIDADMLLINQGFDRDSLDQRVAGYLLIQKNGRLSYANLRLLNTAFEWRAVGVTHEYLDSLGKSRVLLKTLWIQDLGDGGSKADKFQRDIHLLTQGLIAEPHNSRYIFYLAQTYKDIGKFDEAIIWYDRRIQAGGWAEEVWYSKYMKAVCLTKTSASHEEILEAFAAAIVARPTRAEALCGLAAYCREKQDWQNAYFWSKIATTLDYPHQDLLFIEDDCYTWKPLDELSIAAYWCGKLEESQNAAAKLLSQNLPESQKSRIQKNFEILRHARTSQKTLDTYFDKIYVINLFTRQDRWMKIQKRLKKYNITNYQRIDGLPGKLFQGFPRPLNHTLHNPNFIGCLMSHIRALLDAKYHNYSRILILEDDAMFHKNLTIEFAKLQSQLEEDAIDWDLLYLGHGTFFQDQQGKYFHEQIRLLNNKMYDVAKNTWMCHAYGVSSRIYDLIIENYTSNFFNWKELDRWYVEDLQTQPQKYKCFKVYPQLFLQEIDFSDNEGVVKDRNREFINLEYSTYEDYE